MKMHELYLAVPNLLQQSCKTCTTLLFQFYCNVQTAAIKRDKLD